MDDPHSEPRVLHELTQNEMAEDAEGDIAICFVDENDCREISARTVSLFKTSVRVWVDVTTIVV